MAPTKRDALWALVCLLTIQVTAVASGGDGTTNSTTTTTNSTGTTDFSSDRARDGTCSLSKLYCHEVSTCAQNEDHTRIICTCPGAYEGNGYIGDVKNATGCTLPGNPVLCDDNNDCDQHANCVAFMNDTLSKCMCSDGFTGNGSVCADVNECLAAVGPCVEHAICKNSPGNYSCQCDTNKNFVGDGKVMCHYVCFSNADCDKNARCNRTTERCQCHPGYLGNGTFCQDIDECTNGDANCPGNTVCKNTEASYECVCQNGYYLENGNCHKYARHCHELLQQKGSLLSGRYSVDFDGEGPGLAMEVDCVVRGGIAVTEVAPLNSLNSNRPIPKDATVQNVDYPGDLENLINNSAVCYQKVYLQCTEKFKNGMIRWKDAKGRLHRGWGANTPDMCPCGLMRTCSNNCSCGFGGVGVDEGLILQKDQLPVSKVLFPATSKQAGNYFVGKLRCGPETFDIPKDCHEAKFNPRYRQRENKVMYIDVDGKGPRAPFLVYCSQDAYNHVGVTEIPPDRLLISRTAAAGDKVDYMAPGPDVEALISGSVYCSQRIEYDCSKSNMTADDFAVQTSSGTYTYLPGGTDENPGSCPCGLTNSCATPRTKCSCELGGVPGRKDIALVINKKNLPVLRVTSTLGSNSFKIGPLQCSQNQFGIPPNCEKYRQLGVTKNNSYVIDPDGPKRPGSSSTVEPFTAECEMDENQGITVINNDNGGGVDLSTGTSLSINYLDVNPAQVEALKDRSTGCIQKISFSACTGGVINVADITYNGKKQFKDLVANHCPNATCNCSSSLTLLAMEDLPITDIKGKAGIINIGPLKCVEIFSDCESYSKFVNKEGALGEVKLTRSSLTIDPDGMGNESPLVARCVYRDTFITAPSPSRPFLRIPATQVDPKEQCWNLSYTDQAGAGIGVPQLSALVTSSRQCSQRLILTCSNAVATGMVSYRNCGGTVFTKFVAADVEATCQCGATGTCSGGPDVDCNCDTSGTVKTKDDNYIISKDRLPICEVCLKLQGASGAGVGTPKARSIRFDVSELRCGKRPGVKGNCQTFRQEPQFNNLQETIVKQMWFETTGKQFAVGCRFLPTPGHAEMMVRPGTPIFQPGESNNPNITVAYVGFDVTIVRQAVDNSSYCTQDLLFFCTDSLPGFASPYGLYSMGNRLDSEDYELRDLDEAERGQVCNDTRFKATCSRCGSSPRRIVVTNKGKLPITRIFLPPDSIANLTVAIADTTCAYMQKDCDVILKKGKRFSDLLFNGNYLIDPDQAGRVRPFQVQCEFNENVGITKVASGPKWGTGELGASGGDDGADFSFANKYPTASPEQIQSLVQNSEFCWQGVKYACTETPLDSNSGLLDYKGQKLTSFGTVDNSTILGCACSVLGTCKTKGYRCNCAGKGSMVDQGFVTDKNVMPITGFSGKVAPGGSASVTVTDVRCAPSPVDIPKDCAEAYSWKYRYGVNYTASGEFLVSPAPAKVKPFLVYCDFTTDPENPRTVIKPKTNNNPNPVTEDDPDPDVPYQGPTTQQLQALIEVSGYCYQPVKVDCFAAAFIKKGVRYRTTNGVKQAFWSGTGDRSKATCTCGVKKLCGGMESLSQQLSTKCNCDIGDAVWRSDAAILDVTKTGPITELLTSGTFNTSQGRLNLTVGEVSCSPKPMVYNECPMGYSDCDSRARCVDEEAGYRCLCPSGWQGKSVLSDKNRPMANGRQCIDDQECTLVNECDRYNSGCVNTPGSYHCDCHSGYRHPPGDKYKCKDINECKENSHNCDANARCFNIDGSYRCRCKKGYRGNGQKGNCHAVGQCSCFGDPHCMSFDNTWNHYQGRCTHTLAQNECPNQGSRGPKFRVFSKNWDRNQKNAGNYSWVKDVIVEVYNKKIVIGQGLTITVNGKNKGKNYQYLVKNTVLIRVSVIGFKATVYTDFGLEVMADGKDEVSVILPVSFNSSVCGLCGNYNNDPKDDWVIGPKCPAIAGNLTTNEVLLGNSWTEDEKACPVDCDPPPPPTNRTCANPKTETDQICDRLFNSASPFSTGGCLQNMLATDLAGFKESCAIDLCYAEDVFGAMCEVAEAMGKYCLQLLGDTFQWSTSKMCQAQKCKMNEEHKLCGPEKEPNCLSPNPVPISQCQENCYCVKGYVREKNGCVKREDCGCLYEGGLMTIGENQLVSNCTKRVSCTGHNSMVTNQTQCGTNEQCVVDEEGIMICQEIPTTTPEPTTPEPTTPEPTTPEPTTPEPTTPEPTTPEPTTPEPTTPEPTTPEPTTPEPTTPVPTTPEPTTPEPTTPEPTTPEPTTPEPTTPEPTTPEPTTPEPTTPEPTTPEPTTPEPTTPEPTTPEPTTPEPTTPEPTTPEPTTPEPTTPEPTTPEPTTPEPTTPEPTTPEPTTPEPTTPEPTTPEPTTPEPTTPEPTTPEPTTPVPTTPEPTTPEPTTPEPTTPEPTTPEPTTPEPTTPEPTTPVPTTPVPTTPVPTTPVPTTPEPTPEPTTPEPTTPEPTPEPTPAPTSGPTVPPAAACAKSTSATTSKTKYQYKEVGKRPKKTRAISEITTITFSIRGARSDAVLLLTGDPSSNSGNSSGSNNGDNVYEIVLGFDKNKKSILRRARQGKAVATKEGGSHAPLNKKVYRYFWASWSKGLVEVGPQQWNSVTKRWDNRPPFLAYQNSAPFVVKRIFVASGEANTKIRWKIFFPCEVQPTPKPPVITTTPSVPLVSTAPPVRCEEGNCSEPNTKCVDGICVCEMGYTADCTHCVDIDECEKGEACQHLGQTCVNTPGAYRCDCQEGFVMRDGQCHDINECEDPATKCGEHAECGNLLGSYECVCCMGYSKRGEVCRRDKRLDKVYGAPGQECCACTGNNCLDPDPVCGTDGETYANYAAMVVRGCRYNRTIDVSYKGYCEKSCTRVKCNRPYETCRQDPVSGKARCHCPDCAVRNGSASSGPVCATNGRVYAKKCIFELTMCITRRRGVHLEKSLTPCGDSDNAGPVGPWSAWGACSNRCRRGRRRRTRTLRQAALAGKYSLEQSVACYSTCPEGPCKPGTCHNPGQVCEVDTSGNTKCVCPDCTDQPDAPVCAVVGGKVTTYENECRMRQDACQRTRNYQLLKNKSCEDNPPSCAVFANYAKLQDSDGCVSDGTANVGFCYGSCDKGGECCRPDFPSAGPSTLPLTYRCPGNTTKTVQEKLITNCKCVQEPQH